MEEYSGIISLFLACIEFVLFVNLLIFAEKITANNLITGMVGLLFGYQMFEFVICYVGVHTHLMIYLAFLLITLLPPLLLNIVLVLNKTQAILLKLVYIPALLLIFYYPTIISQFVVTECTVMFAAYDIPFADLYGVVYYTPVIISLLFLIKLYLDKNYAGKKSNLIVFTVGIVITFIPTLLIIFFFPSLIDYIESFLCKFAFFIALTSSIFAIRNKTTVIENE